jgi:hypothetical protein
MRVLVATLFVALHGAAFAASPPKLAISPAQGVGDERRGDAAAGGRAAHRVKRAAGFGDRRGAGRPGVQRTSPAW